MYSELGLLDYMVILIFLGTAICLFLFKLTSLSLSFPSGKIAETMAPIS